MLSKILCIVVFLNLLFLYRLQEVVTIPSTAESFNHSAGSSQFDQDAIDTIVRTFRSLPPSEIERLDFDLSTPVMAGTESSQVLIDAWTRRQAEIRQLFDKMVKPVEIMANISKDLLNSSSSDSFRYVRLMELESLLSDIDNARDFHTIGGWPILISYLSPHRSDKLRELAALAVGTAVKNQYDYQLWLIESPTSTKNIRDNIDQFIGNATGLDMLIDILHSHRLEDKTDLLQKTIYAISSAARGNLEIQEHLSRHEYFPDAIAKVTRIEAKNIVRKLWSFVEDMLHERAQFNEFYPKLTDLKEEDRPLVIFKPLGESFCSVFWIDQSLLALTRLIHSNIDEHYMEIDFKYSITALVKVLQLQRSSCIDSIDSETSETILEKIDSTLQMSFSARGVMFSEDFEIPSQSDES
jgi:hypothetical protein